MFYRFDEIKEKIKENSDFSALIGKKAESLINLSGWGFPVPDGGCITTDGFDSFMSDNKMDHLINDIRSDMKNGAEHQVILDKAKEAREVILQGVMDISLVEKLEELQKQHPESHFAVRSSGTKEDLGDASFAGQYSSILNVKGITHLRLAVRQCWDIEKRCPASLFNVRVIQYCLDKNIDFTDMRLSVIVQQMIPAEKSGVLFTVNPITGADKEIMIEACFGIGEALVGGEVTPDHYLYDWYNEVENERTISDKKVTSIAIDHPPFITSIDTPEDKRNAAVLDEDEVRELADLSMQVKAEYGFPVDIEWAKYNDRFYLLQSRPITKIHYSGINDEWTTADFKDGGVSSTVCSQYMWSLYDLIWENEVPGYLIKTRIEDHVRPTVWGDMFYGRPYWNVTEMKKGLEQIPGYKEKDFDESMGIKIAYEGPGFVAKTNLKTIVKGIKVLTALGRLFKEVLGHWPEFKEQQEAKLAKLTDFDPEALRRNEFFTFFKTFICEEYYLSEATYFNSIFASSNNASLFKEKLDKLKLDVNYPNLISGLTDLSHLMPMYRIWDLKETIKADTAACEFWQKTSVAELVDLWRAGDDNNFMNDVRAYIEEFKFHSTRELDITVPRYGEDPSFVMETIKNSLDLGPEMNPSILNKKQNEAYLEERKKLLSAVPFYKRKSIGNGLTELRKFLWWREELRDLSTQYYYYVRKFTLVLAKHLCEMNVLDTVDDIFFLPVEDILSIIKGDMQDDQVASLIKKNKLYYNAFRNYKNPNEIGNRFNNAMLKVKRTGDGVFAGIPCSPGVVTGKVKVIEDIFDSGRIEKGDILITKYTDPGWTPKFGLLAGVVTESGGLLSHAAVISREYGIPAVLAVEDITTSIQDGQVVTIDGNTGSVVIEGK